MTKKGVYCPQMTTRRVDQILELMKSLTKEFGVALIIITHNLGVVARYADRVIVMYAGRIVETASALDLYQNPKHPYTMALLNSVPRLDSGETRVRLDAIDGLPPNLGDLPEGCNFAPRCRFATDDCLVGDPELKAVEGRRIAILFLRTYTRNRDFVSRIP